MEERIRSIRARIPTAEQGRVAAGPALGADGVLTTNLGARKPIRPLRTAGGRRLRIALYSHDTLGLGHLRRNLLIAETLSGSFDTNILVIAGATEADVFARPQGVDCLTLPALSKEVYGYESRSLDLSVGELIHLRAKTICAAMEAFAPDVFIVDKVPRGVVNELNPTLKYLTTRGNVACVLGLRDVLDDPGGVRREWESLRNEEAIGEFYDAVWVYGDRNVYDVVREYSFSDRVAEKVRYTGYLDRRRTNGSDADVSQPAPPASPYVLCTVGGGQDGGRLANNFAQVELPEATHGVLLAGPFMPSEVKRSLRRATEENPRFHVIDFVSDPTALLRNADRVISMGGYNTLSELLSYEKRTLVVPRVTPRREQLIRAERFSQLGLLDVCHPDEMTPKKLGDWIARDVSKPPLGRIDFDGRLRLPELLIQVSAKAQAAERVV